MGKARDVYHRTRKRPDLFWNRFVARPVAAVIVAALAGTRVTPNQITLAALAVAALAAALIVTLPGYLGLLAAVLVFEISYVLDCADGMLARWRGTQSALGHLLDFLMDELKAFLVLAATSVRLHLETGSTTPLLVGIGGLVALASGVALTTFLRRPELGQTAPRSAEHGQRRSFSHRAVGAIEAAAKLLIHYPSYIWLAAAVGRIELYFYPYVAVNALYASRTLLGVAVRFGRSNPH